MRYGLSDSVIQEICGILDRYPHVERAILYGSRAKGNFMHGSDIDLTLCGGADLTFQERNRILDDLDDLLLPYTIDLSVFRDIHDADVIEHIEGGGGYVLCIERRITAQDPIEDGLQRGFDPSRSDGTGWLPLRCGQAVSRLAFQNGCARRHSGG